MKARRTRATTIRQHIVFCSFQQIYSFMRIWVHYSVTQISPFTLYTHHNRDGVERKAREIIIIPVNYRK